MLLDSYRVEVEFISGLIGFHLDLGLFWVGSTLDLIGWRPPAVIYIGLVLDEKLNGFMN